MPDVAGVQFKGDSTHNDLEAARGAKRTRQKERRVRYSSFSHNIVAIANILMPIRQSPAFLNPNSIKKARRIEASLVFIHIREVPLVKIRIS